MLSQDAKEMERFLTCVFWQKPLQNKPFCTVGCEARLSECFKQSFFLCFYVLAAEVEVLRLYAAMDAPM